MSVKQSKKFYATRIDHELLLRCAENKNLSKKAYRVLLYLFSVANSQDFVEVSQKEIVMKIDMDKTSVSLALKNLKEEGIIYHFPYGQSIKFVEEDTEDEFFY
ncbi:hypothetical protein MHB40_24155 [Lysinibacillus sp. FSL K6-0057]|uniref:hypothetical protein n=1 Tax=unclassified Lysinibacillus TaxID=2636778 RepID=UPI0031583EBF